MLEIRLRKTPSGYQIIEGRAGLLEALRHNSTVSVIAGEHGEYEVVNSPMSPLVLRHGKEQWVLEGVEVVGVLSELF